jgi:hypothetical protein
LNKWSISDWDVFKTFLHERWLLFAAFESREYIQRWWKFKHRRNQGWFCMNYCVNKVLISTRERRMKWKERERGTDSFPIVYTLVSLIANISSYSFHITFAQIYPFFLCLDWRVRTHFVIDFYTLRSCLLESWNIFRHDIVNT